MKSYILIDCERITSLLGTWHCTFRFEGDVRWIFGHKNAYKFLVVDDLLLIGAVDGHAELYAAWALRTEPIGDGIKERAETIATEQYGRRNWAVIAAGIVSSEGQVTNWKSQTFRVETPEGMRSELGQEISRLFASGALAPR